MDKEKLTIDADAVRKLLAAASGDAALLYLYIQNGNDPEQAEEALHMADSRYGCAQETLRQLGLWPEERTVHIIPGERPGYSETDVIRAMDSDVEFRALEGEVERVLGKRLNPEELKILLGFVRYLGLPVEVVSLLVCYCKERVRQRGGLRNPSLWSIEKEAYSWAEQGIDTVEAAAAFIQNQNMRRSQISQVMEILQIRGRNLTQSEEQYVKNWLEMGFSKDAVALAYEKTCLNTGGLKWPYMNKILCSWHEAGLHTAEEVRTGDRKPAAHSGKRQLDSDEQEAISRMMGEE